MDRLNSTQLSGLLDFLRAGYACHDQEAFVAHLLDGLQSLIPSEITSYAEVDLSTGEVGNGTRVTPADASFPEDREIFRAHASEHPITTYFRQTGDGRAVKISDFLSERQFHRLGLYQEFFRRGGVEDQMSMTFSARASRVIGISVHRGRRSFSERDRLLLNVLRPHLVQAYQNAQAVTGIQQEGAVLRQAMEASGQAVIILSREGRVRLMTPRAHRWLVAYFGPTGTEQLPEALEIWRTHHEAILDRADDVPHPRKPLQVQRDGTCLLVRHLCEVDRCLLLLEERPTGPQPVSLEAFGLTRREAEVLQWVAQGKTNAEIGCILGLSPRTVDKHVEHLFPKLGVETRMAAAALAQGWNSLR